MKTKLILIIILVVGIFLRFYKLGSLPNAYTPDELAQGYTAYSILQTGQDEWGSNNWFSLRSFGDYKPPIQTLLMIPSIKLFGLTTFAVRFPNAIFSIFTLILTYLIAQKLFKNEIISLVSTLFVALSPWALPMSRIALEANLVIFIVSAAFYFYLIASEKSKNSLLFLSIVLFGVSLFTYHSAKIFSPLLLILLIFFKKTFQQPKKLFFIITFFCLFYGINFWINFQIKSSRTGDIAIFNPTDKWSYVSNSQFEITQNGLPYSATKLIYNKFIYLYETFISSYFSYFSPQFLLTQGAGETTYGMIPGYGVLGLIPYVGLILCFILIIKFGFKSNTNKNIIFLLTICLIPPLIAAIAKGQYSANRVSLMTPFIQIAASAGLILFTANFSKKIQKICFIISFIIFFGFSIIFLGRYFFPRKPNFSRRHALWPSTG